MPTKCKAITMILLFICGCATARGQQTDTLRARMERNVYRTILGVSDSMYDVYVKQALICMTPDSADLLIEEAKKHLGKPYHYGGKGPKAFDCAGFARYVYMKFGFTLPGGSIPQYRLGRSVKECKKLQKGDLVFFQGRSGTGGVGHTGIVTEVDTTTGVFRFIHAATSTGVIYSYSTEAYYAKRYIGARRLLGDRLKPEDPLPSRKRSKR